VQTVGMPKLTEEQIEELCVTAEEAARSYIYSKISPKRIEKLDIIAETEGSKPRTLTLEIELIPSPPVQKINAQRIVDEAIRESFNSAEKYLRKVSCQSSI
jgi:hypothetical protein